MVFGQLNVPMLIVLQTETRVDINCKNADGLTPLLLCARDVHLFERLGERLPHGYDPTEVLELLLLYRA